jgi:hypothetical protein
MKTWICTAVAASALALATPRTAAQYVAGPAGFTSSSNYVPPGMVYPSSINSVAPGGRITVATVNGTYIPPYSYTVVGPPNVARHYSGYGIDDFPFHGRIYGKPNDAWSWTSLSGGYDKALARYYYPPVQ